MALMMLGLSHKTAAVELREALALDPDAFMDQAFGPLRKSGLIEELVLLSTCNRVEAYAVSSQPEEAEQALRKAFEHKAGARAAQARKARKPEAPPDLSMGCRQPVVQSCQQIMRS